MTEKRIAKLAWLQALDLWEKAKAELEKFPDDEIMKIKEARARKEEKELHSLCLKLEEETKRPALNTTFRTDSSMIRNLCIKENYYTCGTNSEYSNLLTYVDEHRDLDESSLDWIAKDILDHSNWFDETVENIKFKILNTACNTLLR